MILYRDSSRMPKLFEGLISFATACILSFTDYEDALQAQCAKRRRLDHIITRDEQGFKDSPVPPLTPTDFIKSLS
jgi:hypothetical protein